jgi:hypothetical protein
MSDIPALLRRVGAFSGLIGAVLIFLGGVITKGGTNVLSYIGVVLAVLGWLIGLYVSLRKGSVGWIGLLLLTVVVSVVLAGIGLGLSGTLSLVLLFIPIAYVGFAASLSQQKDITDRGVIATLGVIAVLTIIISGTFAGGGGIGTTTDTKVYQLNLQMYVVAGVLGAFAWILAIINTARIQAWGWFAKSLFIVCIGATMFGLFGPTAEDVRQGRLQKAARRAAGVR